MFKNEEVKSEKRGTVCYKSDLLGGKYFDSYEELEAAEKKYEVEHAEKEAAKLARKEEADAVKAAITARLEGEAAARKAKAAAYKAYLEACDEAEAEVAALKKEEKEKLNAFCERYGSFHESLTIGDATYRYDYSANQVNYVDPFQKLFNLWF